jgi:hypothetical protein
MRRMFFLVAVTGSPLFQTSVMFFILGFQSMLMGLIAELLARTYHESQRKPTYTIFAIGGDSAGGRPAGRFIEGRWVG